MHSGLSYQLESANEDIKGLKAKLQQQEEEKKREKLVDEGEVSAQILSFLKHSSTELVVTLQSSPSSVPVALKEVRVLMENMATEVKKAEMEKVAWKERIRKVKNGGKEETEVDEYGGGPDDREVECEEELVEQDLGRFGGWDDSFGETQQVQQQRQLPPPTPEHARVRHTPPIRMYSPAVDESPEPHFHPNDDFDSPGPSDFRGQEARKEHEEGNAAPNFTEPPPAKETPKKSGGVSGFKTVLSVKKLFKRSKKK